MEDRLIIERVLSGDQEAFRALIEQYKRLVAHIVFRMLPFSQDREDVCQDVFIKVYTNLSRFRFKSKLSTWIAKIAHNTCIGCLEKKRLPAYNDTAPENETIEDVPGVEANPETLAAKGNISGILETELSEMPVRYRTVLTLFHLDGLSYEEIAQIMEIPEGTVKSHLFRGRKYLRDRLLSEYGREELLR